MVALLCVRVLNCSLGIALSVTIVVGSCVTAATLLILKDIREEREIRTTRMGKSFLRVAGGDMKQVRRGRRTHAAHTVSN